MELNSEPVPLSHGQQRLWFLHRLNGESLGYHVTEAFRLRGKLNLDAMRHAIQAIVERHEILRTHFRAEGDSVVQVVDPRGLTQVLVEDLSVMACDQRESRIGDALADEWERPFDLAAGPLARYRLLRLSADDNVLIVTMHHMVTDGWSQEIWRREFETLYNAFCEGRENPLPALPLQYPDFAVRQRRDGGAYAGRELLYWRRQLAGLSEGPSPLPSDRREAASRPAPVPMTTVALGPELASRLRETSRTSRCTLFMTLIAAFAILLHRYCGTTDIVIGTPVAGRNKLHLEKLIGFFVNMLPMRFDVSPAASFADYLGQVRGVALSAYANQDIPFELIVQELSPARNPDRNPFFQVTFALQPARGAVPRLSGLAVTDVPLRDVRSRFDLELYAWEQPDDITLGWVYDASRFDRWRIDQMARHYLRIIERVSADPGVVIRDIDLLTDDERLPLPGRPRFTVTAPAGGTAYRLFAERAALDAAAIAVRRGSEEVSYGELGNRARDIASRLTALGLSPGARVGVGLQPGIGLVAAILAILRSGAVYVPLPLGHPRDRLALMMRTAMIDFTVTSAAIADRMPMAARRVTVAVGEAGAVGEVRAGAAGEQVPAPVPAPDAVVAGNSVAYVAYVSAAKSAIQGVEMTHAGLYQQLTSLREELSLAPGDRILQRMPVEWGVSATEILAPLAAGATLVIADYSRVRDPDYLVRLVSTERISVLFLDPALLRSVADRAAPDDCASLRGVVCQAEGLTQALAATWRERARARLWAAHGATETTAYSVLAGRPAGGAYLLVLDERLRMVPAGVPGELYVGGPCLARGYVSRPSLTAERFVADPFNPGQRIWRSGVLAGWRPDGRLDFLGRSDARVAVHGWQAEPGEIEEVLRRHPHVREAVVMCDVSTGYPRLRAFAESYADDPALPGELHDHVAAWLPWYAAPASIATVDELPRTEDGRIDRGALAQRLPEAAAGAELASPLEEQLCALFAQILKITSVAPHDDFFRLGGHSLAAMSLVAKIYDTLGADLTIRDVFEAPTAAALANLVGR